MLVVFDRAESVAKNISTFWFRTPQKVNYTAGQFVEIYLPHINPDKRGTKHWFTLSSSPTEDRIAITTKLDTQHVSSFKQKLFSLSPGDEVKISEPMGDFVLPKDVTIPLVFVAGGIGITPVRSIIKWLIDSRQTRQIHLIYTAQDETELAFMDLFKSYDQQIDIILSNPKPDWRGAIGRLTGKQLLKIAGHSHDQYIYVSGPEPMTEKLEKELLAEKFPPSNLILDFFPNYPAN